MASNTVFLNETSPQPTRAQAVIQVENLRHLYDGRAALSTWIYAITRNRCLSALERTRASLVERHDVIQVEDGPDQVEEGRDLEQ